MYDEVSHREIDINNQELIKVLKTQIIDTNHEVHLKIASLA